MYKVIVAGTRTFKDFKLLEDSLNYYFSNLNFSDIEIVSGGAEGADKLGERFARKYGCHMKQFIPKWQFGKRAGYIRNKDMAEYADYCIVFWDGRSKGSKHMIDIANKEGLKLRVIKYEERKE